MGINKKMLVQMGFYSALITEMCLSVAAGLVGGYYADRYLGTSPWLLILGMIAGIGAGIHTLVRIVHKFQSRI
ncbi:MAG: AtpZ/AtpI family protein [Deltaproteobacteria bacterium]|nr:AtpZ/AtpI family protein [Deltaproteobacteria bacterium]MBW2149292.1 AtpZ/AtpI family protein [Deltaproteobacteria bacterium]MBW2307410.1 AtpZ/AtpI family protein [Deltaproteobacteria bacterium]